VRDLHGALLDAGILADVYLAMTGGQTHLSLAGEGSDNDASGRQQASPVRRLDAARKPLPVMVATAEELEAHAARLRAIEKASGAPALWARLETADSR
jgi:DNA polymerase-3 subunit epsilon